MYNNYIIYNVYVMLILEKLKDNYIIEYLKKNKMYKL